MSAYDRTKNLGFFRDATVTWLSGRFDSTPQSLMLAISLLDRFLGIVSVRIARSRAFRNDSSFSQVKAKYLKCLAATCYYIAAKTTQESKVDAFFSSSRGGVVDFPTRRKRYRRKKSRAYATTSSRRPISSEWSASC